MQLIISILKSKTTHYSNYDFQGERIKVYKNITYSQKPFQKKFSYSTY